MAMNRVTARVSLLPRERARILSAHTTLVIDLFVGDDLQASISRTVEEFERFYAVIKTSSSLAAQLAHTDCDTRCVEAVERFLNTVFAALDDGLWRNAAVRAFIDGEDAEVSPLQERRIKAMALHVSSLQQRLQCLQGEISLSEENIARVRHSLSLSTQAQAQQREGTIATTAVHNTQTQTLVHVVPTDREKDIRVVHKLRRGSSSLSSLPEMDNEEDSEEEEENNNQYEYNNNGGGFDDAEEEEEACAPVPLRMLPRAISKSSQYHTVEKNAQPASTQATRTGTESETDTETDVETVSSSQKRPHTHTEVCREGSLRRGSSSSLSFGASLSSLPEVDQEEETKTEEICEQACEKACVSETQHTHSIAHIFSPTAPQGTLSHNAHPQSTLPPPLPPPPPCAPPPLPESSILPVDLLRVALREDCAYESTVNELLVSLTHTPHTSPTQAHARRVRYLTEQLTRNCGVRQVCDVSLHCVDCALLDDEVRLLCVPAAHSPTHTAERGSHPFTECEKAIHTHLRALSALTQHTQHRATHAEASECVCAVVFHPQQQKPGEITGTIEGVSFSLFLLCVNPEKTEGESHLPDNAQSPHASHALHTEAVWLLLLDEFNALVGQGQLFARSLSLLRSWWHCESALYVGATIKHYLSTSSFSVLVLALFNRYYLHIKTPFQVLCLFFAEYASLRPAEQRCSVWGYADVCESEIRCENVQYLVDEQFFEKYRRLLNMKDPSSLSLSANSTQTGVCAVHPLTGENMIRNKLSANQVIRLTKALQNGAASLAVFLRQLATSEDNGENTVSSAATGKDSKNRGELIRNFFPNIVSAMGTEREDSFLTTSLMDKDKSGNRAERRNALLQCVRTVRLLCEGELSDEGLCAVLASLLRSHAQTNMRTTTPLSVGDVCVLLWEGLSLTARAHIQRTLCAERKDNDGHLVSRLCDVLLDVFKRHQDTFIVAMGDSLSHSLTHTHTLSPHTHSHNFREVFVRVRETLAQNNLQVNDAPNLLASHHSTYAHVSTREHRTPSHTHIHTQSRHRRNAVHTPHNAVTQKPFHAPTKQYTHTPNFSSNPHYPQSSFDTTFSHVNNTPPSFANNKNKNNNNAYNNLSSFPPHHTTHPHNAVDAAYARPYSHSQGSLSSHSLSAPYTLGTQHATLANSRFHHVNSHPLTHAHAHTQHTHADGLLGSWSSPSLPLSHHTADSRMLPQQRVGVREDANTLVEQLHNTWLSDFF